MYDREEIERLMPCLWDLDKAINGIINRLAPDHDMPKGSPPNPAHAGSHWVAVADMRRAWALARLSLRHRQILILRYGLDSTYYEIAQDLGMHERGAGKGHDTAIERIAEFLNGRPLRDPLTEREDTAA